MQRGFALVKKFVDSRLYFNYTTKHTISQWKVLETSDFNFLLATPHQGPRLILTGLVLFNTQIPDRGPEWRRFVARMAKSLLNS